jgi:hypothetical protein
VVAASLLRNCENLGRVHDFVEEENQTPTSSQLRPFPKKELGTGTPENLQILEEKAVQKSR